MGSPGGTRRPPARRRGVPLPPRVVRGPDRRGLEHPCRNGQEPPVKGQPPPLRPSLPPSHRGVVMPSLDPRDLNPTDHDPTEIDPTVSDRLRTYGAGIEFFGGDAAAVMNR